MIDVKKLAEEAVLEEAVSGLWYVSEDGLKRFAALVLEEAAEVCDAEGIRLFDVKDVSAAQAHPFVNGGILAVCSCATKIRELAMEDPYMHDHE